MEGTSKSSNQENPVYKKNQALIYVRQKLEKSKDRLDSLSKQMEYYKSYKSSPTPIFDMPVGDGGMDIQDRKVEVGSAEHESQQHDYYTSPLAEDELKNLADFVEKLEEDLKSIENNDEQVVNGYYKELQILPNK